MIPDLVRTTLLFTAALVLSATLRAEPETIHVVFKTHLDVGFTDFPERVVAKYCDEYIPRALATARAMRAAGTDRFIWTTGSWLVDKYLERATPSMRVELEAALRDGTLAWHAYPVSAVNELLDASLFRYSLDLARKLDARYGRTTLAAKLTDVPGETRAVLPSLQNAGIRLLHIGVNGASTPPATPPVFLWRDASGAEVVAMVEPRYGSTVEVPGFPAAIHFAFTGDNKGPQTPEQVKAVFARLREKYPHAVVKASTMDNFARELWSFRDRLPVVTSEIGSSWVHSAGTDPKRYAQFRALMRLRTRWLAEGRISPRMTRNSEGFPANS